jgi:hypothetical protein
VPAFPEEFSLPAIPGLFLGLFFHVRQKSDIRLAGRVSPGNTLLEQLPLPFFQKAVDFYDEFMEFLRVVLVGRSLAKFAPGFFFFADHPDNAQLWGELNRPLCHKRAMLCCSVSYFPALQNRSAEQKC